MDGAFEPCHVRNSSTIGIATPSTIAAGRRETRRSGRRSMNGHEISSTISSVGMMIVANSSISGCLKMRSSWKRKKKYHSGRGS